MSEAEVRDATLADVPAMARVHVRSWRETYRGYVPDDVLDAPDFVARRERMWTTALSDDRYADQRIAVAEQDGEIVGIASAGPPTGDEAVPDWQLYTLYLLAAHHGSGTGQRLLDAVLGDRASVLWVADPNPRAQVFYRRNGFVPDGAVHADGPREIRMSRL